MRPGNSRLLVRDRLSTEHSLLGRDQIATLNRAFYFLLIATRKLSDAAEISSMRVIRFVRKCVSLAILLAMSAQQTDSYACTAVLLSRGDQMTVGFNENWKLFPGFAYVNMRNQKRSYMAWDDILRQGSTDSASLGNQGWRAKYGSVTFNCFGEHYPIYGVNEKRLFLAELYLEGTVAFKRPDQKFLFYPLWIQYQLDRYATVHELVENLRSGPMPQYWPIGFGAHFFVSDASGATAELSFKDGKIKVIRDMPVKVLCNAVYTDEHTKLKAYRQFGGAKEFDREERSWPLRFVRAAHLIDEFSRNTEIDINKATWRVLDNVIAGSWQLVYNQTENRVYYRTRANKHTRWIDLSRIDFGQSKAVAVDINANTQGDQADALRPIAHEENRSIIEKALPIGCPHRQFLDSPDFMRVVIGLSVMPVGREE